jgi:predicted transposase YdaD
MISGFVDTYLKLNAAEEEIFKAEIAKFEPVKQEEVMEIVTSWMQEGIERGKLEGKLEGEFAIITRQLNRRIGLVTPELQDSLKKLSTTQLEDLAEALFDFSSVDDLLTWLNGQQRLDR